MGMKRPSQKRERRKLRIVGSVMNVHVDEFDEFCSREVRENIERPKKDERRTTGTKGRAEET